MRNTYTLAVTLVIFFGCASRENISTENSSKKIETSSLVVSANDIPNWIRRMDLQYISIEPIESETYTRLLYIQRPNEMNSDYTIDEWPSENTNRNNLLPNQSANVTISSIDSNGNISFIYGSTTGSAGAYIVVMDYMKYKNDVMLNDKRQIESYAKVGVGVRITAYVTVSNASVNLSNLFSLGAAYENKQLSGTIKYDVIGISHKDITQSIPLVTEINSTTITAALQSMNNVKRIIHDQETVITPHIFAIGIPKVKDRTKIDEILKSPTPTAIPEAPNQKGKN